VREIVSPVPRPFGLAVNQANEDLWVGSFAAGTIERYTTRGGRIDLIVRVGGFERPLGIAVDPIDAGLWVVDSGPGAIAKLTTAGAESGRVGGLSLPFDVDVGPGRVARSR
jgi:DNA-binding beta-propeller fold protein YncE